MDKQLKSQVVFHLTGRHAEGGAASDAVRGMRPALMAPYRRLEGLRYDFPVVLAADGATPVRSLTSMVDAALRAVAPPGVDGEALRRRALQIEREIRRLVAGGEGGTLTELWDRAAMTLVPKGDVAFLTDALKVRGAFEVDGPVADCNAALPARFMRHTWSVVQAEKSRRACERIGNLEGASATSRSASTTSCARTALAPTPRSSSRPCRRLLAARTTACSTSAPWPSCCRARVRAGA